MSRLKRLLAELQRRRVYRVAVVYAAVAFVIWQATEIAFPALRLPDWSLTLVVVLSLVGFPIALVLAWVFDITPQGVRRTEPSAPETEAHRARPPATRMIALAAVAVLSVVAGWLMLQAVLAPEEYSVPNPRRSMVILPFAVTAPDTSLDWLAEGAAAMLTTNLEGWRELHVADRRRLAALGRSRGLSLDDPLDLSDGLALARDALVGTLLLGEVLGYGGSVDIVVRAYDVATGEPIRDPERARGSSADPRPLVDSIASRILEISEAPALTPNIREATTNSLQAYQKYLQGRRHLYRWQLSDAAARFRAAIGEDSTFALAYHGLALALSLQAHESSEVRRLTTTAVRHGERLPWREKQHVRAFNAFQHGDFELARRIYRKLIEADSADAEAWYHLGEVEYHDRNLIRRPDGTLWPRSNLNVALRAFERAVNIDPGFHLGYGHSFDILSYAWQWTAIGFHEAPDMGAVTRREPDRSLIVAWRDSVLWVPFDPSDPNAAWRPNRSDSITDLLKERAIAVARRWSNAAPDEAKPHQILRDQYITHHSTLPLALREDQAVVRLSGDTTPRERFRLANLYLANEIYDTAFALVESGLAALGSQGTESADVPPLAANIFMARGQPSRALKVVGRLEKASGRMMLPNTKEWISTPDFEPLVDKIRILGSCGANRPELIAAFDSLHTALGESSYSAAQIEGLYESYATEVVPALLVLEDDLARDWLARRPGEHPFWEVYFEVRADREPSADKFTAVARSFDQTIEGLDEHGWVLNPESAYLLAIFAQTLGRDSLAAYAFHRMDPLPVENKFAGEPPYSVLGFDPNWGLLSLSYLKRARSYEMLGDTANAVHYYKRFLQVWRDAEPDLLHYADDAREALNRLRGAGESVEDQ